MKNCFVFLLVWALAAPAARAQDLLPRQGGLPLTVSVFTESVSLPTFKGFLKGGYGVKVGTEFYYRNRPGHQLFQTLNAGYYHHPRLQSAVFVSSEVGYRKYVGPFYAEALVGLGGQGLAPAYPSYRHHPATGEYRKVSPLRLKAMPTASLGAGYRFPNQTAVFTRYEVFGELPFSQVALPHRALHLGARLPLNR